MNTHNHVKKRDFLHCGSKLSRQGCAPPPVQIFSFSCNCREKFGQTIGWHPTLEVFAPPPVWEILDPPLAWLKRIKLILPVCGASRYEDAGSDGNLFQIVNGWEARIHEFPWQVTISFRNVTYCLRREQQLNVTKRNIQAFVCYLPRASESEIWLYDCKCSYPLLVALSTYAVFFNIFYEHSGLSLTGF